MVLEFHQKNFSKLKCYFFKKLDFMEFKDFGKLKYPKSSKSLHISEIVVN